MDGDRIASIGAVEGSTDTIDLNGGWVVPGYIDTQVNGGGGVLFNDRLDVDGIATMAAAHAVYGTTAMLPTLVSETPDKIARALDAIDEAIEAKVPGIVGIHVEGPVLNPARKGIHDPVRFRDLDDDMVAVLTRPRKGKVMLTIAPERVPLDTIKRLVAAGVLVSAGHSEASYEQAMAAFDVGLSGITHLYNAMPAMQQRVPGLAGATLDDPRPWSGLIIDGFHVSAPMLRLALKARPFDKLMLVTDAMSSVGAVEKDFVLHGRPIAVSGGKCVNVDGTLAGSDLDMGAASPMRSSSCASPSIRRRCWPRPTRRRSWVCPMSAGRWHPACAPIGSCSTPRSSRSRRGSRRRSRSRHDGRAPRPAAGQCRGGAGGRHRACPGLCRQGQPGGRRGRAPHARSDERASRRPAGAGRRARADGSRLAVP